MSDLPTPSPTLPPDQVDDYDSDLLSLIVYLMIILLICVNCSCRARRHILNRVAIRRLRIESGVVYDVEIGQYDFSQCLNIIKLPQEQQSCIICFEDFTEDDVIVEIKKCKHIYHKHCVNTWLNEKPLCPICRERVFPNFI